MSIPEPKPPSTDITDPKVLAGAKRVATRRNNDARRKLAKERAALPLLADQIPAAPDVLDTPEQVIERRILCQIGARENAVDREIAAVRRVLDLRDQCFAMVPEDEYLVYFERSLEIQYPEWAYWGNVMQGIRERAEPMPEICLWVLTLLADWEGEPPTFQQIHLRCGDGQPKKAIGDACLWLERRLYIKGGVLRPEPLAGFTTESGFQVPGYGTPWSITDAGRRFLEPE